MNGIKINICLQKISWIYNLFQLFLNPFDLKMIYYDIFNTDEIALSYKVLPEATYQYKDSKSDYIKVCKERQSLLFCSNITVHKILNGFNSHLIQGVLKI